MLDWRLGFTGLEFLGPSASPQLMDTIKVSYLRDWKCLLKEEEILGESKGFYSRLFSLKPQILCNIDGVVMGPRP